MKNEPVLTLGIIGGGASGLIAAVFAAREADRLRKRVRITVYDANPRVGKKILVTGNGRCNFSNENISDINFHGEGRLAYSIYERFDNEDTVEVFSSHGLFSKADAAGRIYPMSSQATAVLYALRYELARIGVEEKTETRITEIKKQGKGYLLNGQIYADRCIIATGGKAAPVQGSDGSGLKLLEACGVKITPLVPALVPLVCDNFPKGLKGIRAQGRISLKCSGKTIAEDTGEIQYTDYGLSGIPSMQVSRFAADRLLVRKEDVYAYVDSCPYFSADELKEKLGVLIKNRPSLPGEMLLAGIMPKKLGAVLLSDCSVNPAKEIGKIHPAVIDKIVAAVKNKKYKVSSVKGFADAQVTAGGIDGTEINADDLSLKRLDGVFVCGEIVNVDGDCGGYNLQWAWSSGAVAGKAAVREN